MWFTAVPLSEMFSVSEPCFFSPYDSLALSFFLYSFIGSDESFAFQNPIETSLCLFLCLQKQKKSISGSGWEASSLLGTNHKPTVLLRRNCFQMEAKIEEGLHCYRIHRRYFWLRHPFRFVRFNIQEHSSPVSTKLSRQNAARRFLKEVELKTGSEAVSHSEWSVRSCSQDTRAGRRRVGLMVDGIHVSCEESVLILLCLLQTMWTVMSSFKIIICHTAWYPSNIYITRCSPCQKIL